jgi:trk system potassium uptake protein TrkH
MLRGQDDVNLFGRRLNRKTIMQSVSIGITAVLWLMLSIIILTATESLSFLSLMFEAVSALGTVGLSMGITADLSAWGKIIIISSMLIGRIGPLGVAYALVRKERIAYRYPQEDIFVG